MMNKLFVNVATVLILFSVVCPLSSGTVKPPQENLITSVTENPDVEHQLKGEYPELERVETQPLGAIQRAWDKAPATAGIYSVVYRPSEVIRIRTREYMTTTIVLPPWERITEIILGDETAYEARQPKPQLILIRPKEFVGIDSTLTLIGASGRVYSFYVRTEGYNSKNISDVSVYVRVPIGGQKLVPVPIPAKAENTGIRCQNEQSPDYLEDAYVDPSELNFAFTMAGDPEIAPERVYSDGIRTWFDYGAGINQQSLPTIYKVEDGIDTPINVNREGSTLVAQAVGNFCLKHGKKIVCVMADR